MKRQTSYFIVIGLIILGILVLNLHSSQPIVVMQGSNPVQFNSTRKHPFDVFSDPYHPPERTNPYLFGRDYNYQQVGVLNGDNAMLPLFGRPSPKSSNLWEYYTMNGGMKLPVSIDGRLCSSDKGCNEMLSGNAEKVNVHGLGKFNSLVYDTEQL
jgi:hypothetical protein